MNINYENIKAAYYRGHNILKIYSGSTMEWEYETEPMEQTTKQIWYNSISGDVVEPYAASAIGTLVSNTAYETKCVLEFSGDVTAIGANAFSGCTDLEYVSLPASATSIGANAFDGCSSLDGIYMPSVESIGREAFKDCGFSSFTISSAVTAITADAFKGVEMKSFNYGGTKAQWSAVTTGDFWDEDTWMTNVVHCSDGDIELFPRNYAIEYFTIEFTSAGYVRMPAQYINDNKMLFSTDNGATWQNYGDGHKNAGDKVLVKANIKYTSSSFPALNITTQSTQTPYASFIAYGNTMSLFYGDDFKGKTSLNNKTFALNKLFSGATTLTSAENLILPATTLSEACYDNMFRGCTSLTAAPQLRATTLANGCYRDMFNGCTSLTTAPSVLPATTLIKSCYESMFKDCTSLTKAPVLSATTIERYSYSCDYMFQGCSSLNYIKMLATNIAINAWGDTYDFNDWVQGVAATGTFIKAASMTSLPTGVNGIPNGWTVYDDGDKALDYLTFVAKSGGTFAFSGTSTANTISYSTDSGSTWSTPSSNVTINVNSGDSVMWKGEMTANINGIGTYSASTASFDAQGNTMSLLFGDNYNNQTSLSGKNYAFKYLFKGSKVVNSENMILPATTLSTRCYTWMFSGCTSMVTAPELPATTMAECSYGNMFEGCSSLTTAPELPATTLSSEAYSSMFQNCTSLTTAPTLPATTLVQYCYKFMFKGCTNLTTAPELLATRLEQECYFQMFSGCRNLNYIKMLGTNVSAFNCLANWVYGVAASGTFVKDANTTIPTGDNGIPNGWTVQDDVPSHDYSQDYFTIVAREDGTINVYGCDYFDQGEEAMGWCEIEYSTDNGETWAVAPYAQDDGPSTITFNVQSGDTIMLKYDARTLYDNPDIGLNNEGVICLFNAGYGSAQFDVQGNIMSLIYGDDFTENTSLDYNEREIKFASMFQNNEMLVSAENLVLPSTTLAEYCYASMFEGCTSLITAPQLPSTTLAEYCYASMFEGCTSLTTAPSLPATTLADKCYSDMFDSCTSLTTAPELPATTLVGACYYAMFRGCESLETAPELPAAILTDNGGEGCYQEMFNGCTSLNYIKMLATDISAQACLYQWVMNVASTGTFIKDPSMTTLPSGASGIPRNWTVQNA